MKKKGLFISFLVIAYTANTQNLQLHYDFGEGRKFLTSTVEMFRSDRLGSTFFFIDRDYNSGGIKGVSMAYWEIARALKLPEIPVLLHLEYNGGLGQQKESGSTYSYTINNSWLTGLEYSLNSSDFSEGLTLQALYKYIRGKHKASFQLTAIWYCNFFDDKITFTGFSDFWREDMVFEISDGHMESTRFVWQSEPQIWYNFSKHLAIGCEIEFSNNFAGKGFSMMPTAGIKATY